jgi:uncharacterized RDD family membrane protein YckC
VAAAPAQPIAEPPVSADAVVAAQSISVPESAAVVAPAIAAPPPLATPVLAGSPALPAVEKPVRPSTATRAVTEVHARPAALWRRSIATVIDSALLAATVVAYFIVAARVIGAHTELSAMTGLDAIAQQLHAWGPLLVPGGVLMLVLGAVYAGAFALLWGGRTPGRLLTGIRLVDASGYPPGPWRAGVRAVLSLFSFVLLLGGFWFALFDRRGQTLHDKLTRTFVVQPS